MTATRRRLRWAVALPTRTGWYWWREHPWAEAEPVNVWDGGDGLYFQWFSYPLKCAGEAEDMGGEWKGPLDPEA